MKLTVIKISLLACTSLLCTQTSIAQKLERAVPETVGLSSERLTYADSIILQGIENGNMPGAVLAVVKDGKMAYLKAYGNKSVYPEREPMTANTVFDMASCSKSMSTAICAMILVERGKLRLTDPVENYIPGFKNWESKDGKTKRTIRISHLMTHTSGLPAYAPVAELQKRYGAPQPDSLMSYIASWRRDFEPGKDFQYSCLNYITLQNIIQRISGMSLREFARRNIFDVLGMNHTDYIPCAEGKDGCESTDVPCWADRKSDDWKEIIAPTTKQPDGKVLRGQVHDPLARVMNGGISGNAGVFSTADDVALLCAALDNGGSLNGRQILSPATVKTMTSVPSDLKQFGRTPGWDCYSPYSSNVGDLLSDKAYGHTGYTGTSIVIDPENHLSIILLAHSVHPVDETSVVRIRSLVANAVAGALVKGRNTYTEHYYERRSQFDDESPVTSSDIIMLGNSLTENGGNWSARLDNKNIRNRGIIGDDIPGMYDRLYQILPGHPAKLFLMAGINDLSHDLSVNEIAASVERIVKKIRTESPQTKLYLQSLLPINESFNRYKRLAGKTDSVPAINAKLRELSEKENITYIDLFPLFKEPDSNSMKKELSTDGLHINEAGYAIWTKKLKKHI